MKYAYHIVIAYKLRQCRSPVYKDMYIADLLSCKVIVPSKSVKKIHFGLPLRAEG